MDRGKEIETQIADKEIAAQKWIFAKTYAKTAPHEYIVRDADPGFFDRMCGMIDEQGSDEEWKDGRTYRYLRLGGHKYWHFDIILNRETI